MKVLLLNILLIIDSIYDIKTMQIPFKMILAHFLLSASVIIISLYQDKEKIGINPHVLLFFFPLIILFVYLIKRQAFGEGDLFLLILIFPVIGMYSFIFSISLAFILSGIVSGFFLLINKMNGKCRIPFTPFITLGVVICCLINSLGGIVK